MRVGLGGARQPSLRQALLVGLLLPLAGLIPLSAGLIYVLAVRPALDGLDRALTDMAVALSQIVEVRDGQAVLPLSEQTARALKADLVDETYFAVSDGAGRLLGGTPGLQPMAPALRAGDWLFFDSKLDGKGVRVAAHAMPCGASPGQPCLILVAETLGKRDAAERAVLLAALLGGLAMALPVALLAMVAVDRGLSPLRAAAVDVGSRTPDRLEPIDARTVPAELVVFVQAINGLFARLREAAAAQRAFVADAAHQLRTPLSVLRIEAARALEMAGQTPMRPVLQRLHAGAERGARLAQQLLALARCEGAELDPARLTQSLDLGRLAAEAAERWLEPSRQAGQDLGYELAPAWVVGDATLLTELLGNLTQNAIEHAGQGARITIHTSTKEGTAMLCVEDDGPGLAPAEREAVWQRFRRGQGAQGTGSGLGLAIVRDIARLHGAEPTLEAGEQGRGLRVCVRFTARPAPN